MKSGYYDVELSNESQPKSVFATQMGKFEFALVPFGLSQTPVCFQRLFNEVLTRLDFDFEYVDDILVLSPDMKVHLKCQKISI